MGERGSSARYELSNPVKAVKLEDQPGSSLRSPTEILIEIPATVIVEMEGAPAPSGLCTILWNGVAYSVFWEDLKEHGKPLEEGGE